MTREQENAVARLRRLVEKECQEFGEEIKRFDVTEYERFVSVYVVYGIKNDEHSYAVLARDYAHLFIGKRGGVRFPVTSKNGNQYCIPFKWYSILQAVCRQRGNTF